MSHCGEASVKGDGKVCDFCPIITPIDYTVSKNWKKSAAQEGKRSMSHSKQTEGQRERERER